MNFKKLKKAVNEFNKSLRTRARPPEVIGTVKGKDIDEWDREEGAVFANEGEKAQNPNRIDAVVDEGTANYPGDLPVVMAIGINYGQVKTGHSNDTYLTKGLTTLKTLFQNASDRGALIPERYHILAWNLFPKLTPRPWADYKFNALEETLVLWRFGYTDWLEQTISFIKTIGPNVVVFHGVNNAVPYHSMLLADRIRPDASEEYPRVVFCGNLAWPGQMKRAGTTVEIRPPPIQRHNVHVVADE